MSVDPQLRRARLAVVSAFFLNGFLLASWVVNIPAIEDRTGLSHATLGSLLLLLGLGSFVAMQAGGWAVDRVGSRAVTVTGVGTLAAAAVLPGYALDATTLAVAVLALGVGNGLLDVAMNAHAVTVEERYGRPLMSGFHAFFSIGGAVGAACGALAHALEVPLPVLLPVVAGLALVVGALTLPGLLPPAPAVPIRHAVATGGPEQPVPTKRILALAGLAFALMLAEGAAADWSALHAREHLGASDSAAALAYAGFAVAMTAGRLVADRVAVVIGPVAVIRYGSTVATAGITLAVLSPALPLTVAGWALFGLGLSGSVPQIFSAAGRLSEESSGVVLSRVVGAGYLGLLAGPAAVGWLAEGSSLGPALLVPAALCALAAVGAGVVVARRQPALSSR